MDKIKKNDPYGIKRLESKNAKMLSSKTSSGF